jgi:putative sporulation protein YtaF
MGLLLLVIAVSLDGFGVGMTYGMRNVQVPLNALIIIMLCSGIVVLSSMTLGTALRSLISPDISSMFGGVILILLGFFSLYNILRPEKANRKNGAVKHRLDDFKEVLATPHKADLDKSGKISSSEALLLGIALALDAFGAGFGASMLGYSPLLTAVLVACMSGLFLLSGIKIGVLLSRNKFLQRLTFLPPLLLIGLGISNFM